jgi:hypothetical protein
VDHLSIHE